MTAKKTPNAKKIIRAERVLLQLDRQNTEIYPFQQLSPNINL